LEQFGWDAKITQRECVRRGGNSIPAPHSALTRTKMQLNGK
jgi:hypothetical protein